MSIDKVEVTNSRGDLLTLTLADISNGYIVEEITGLDPVKASIVSSNFATMDGQQYQASSRDVRNITIKLGYAPNYSIDQTIRDLRTQLYDYFMPDEEVSLAFYMEDGVTASIAGRVETCEAPLFSQEPQMDISILCMNPDFIGTDLVAIHDTFTTTDTSAHTINYTGTVRTGLTSIKFTAATSITDVSIYHTSPTGVLRTMLISAPLVLGDVVNICTIKGQKSITLTRSGVTSSLLWAVSPQSDWIQLERGSNQFYLNASETTPSAVWVDYYNRYGGM